MDASERQWKNVHPSFRGIEVKSRLKMMIDDNVKSCKPGRVKKLQKQIGIEMQKIDSRLK